MTTFFYVNEPNERKKSIRTINQTKSLLFLHIEIAADAAAAATAGGVDGAVFLFYFQMKIKRKCSV